MQDRRPANCASSESGGPDGWGALPGPLLCKALQHLVEAEDAAGAEAGLLTLQQAQAAATALAAARGVNRHWRSSLRDERVTCGVRLCGAAEVSHLSALPLTCTRLRLEVPASFALSLRPGAWPACTAIELVSGGTVHLWLGSPVGTASTSGFRGGDHGGDFWALEACHPAARPYMAPATALLSLTVEARSVRVYSDGRPAVRFDASGRWELAARAMGACSQSFEGSGIEVEVYYPRAGGSRVKLSVRHESVVDRGEPVDTSELDREIEEELERERLQRQPQQRAPRACAAPGCGATAGLRRCGGCGAVRYCSEACSKAHWRAHKAECRRVQAERAAAAEH